MEEETIYAKVYCTVCNELTMLELTNKDTIKMLNEIVDESIEDTEIKQIQIPIKCKCNNFYDLIIRE